MAYQSAGSGEPASDEPVSGAAPAAVVVGAGTAPAAALLEAQALGDILVDVPATPGARHRWPRHLGAGLALGLLLVASAMLPPGQPAEAEAPLVQPLPAGAQPFGVAVNPATNRAYVTNFNGGTVTVIDGATNTVIGDPITVGQGPAGIDVNTQTNRIYVAMQGNSDVVVLDGATNRMVGTPILTGANTRGVAVNPITNRIYASNSGDATVSVIDGVSNRVVGDAISVGMNPEGVAVNFRTNRIYVANFGSNIVSVIDGATSTVVGNPISVGTGPEGIGVNPNTNRIYVANQVTDTVSEIDGATNTVIGTLFPVGSHPIGVAVNVATNRIYLADHGGTNVTVVDGLTNAVVGLPVPVGTAPRFAAVNPITNQVYVANQTGGTVSVVGVPFSVVITENTPADAITSTWRKLFAPDGGDFLGLYPAGSKNGTPLSRRFTNGTDRPGAQGVSDGSADLTIPAGLPGGTYEVRLVSGSSGGTLATVSEVAPTAGNDTYAVDTGTVLTVASPGVLANDSIDAPTDLTAAVVGKPAHGTLVLQTEGGFTYAPNAGFAGTDSFTYRALGKVGLPAVARVDIVMVFAPVAANDAYTVAAGTILNVPAPGVLANDTDRDSPVLQTVLVTNPAHGLLSLQPNGSFGYTPAAGFAGTDSFTYRASDGPRQSEPATVAITVTPPPPAPPVAVNDAYSVTQGSTLNVAAPGVLANDTDADSPSLQAVLATNPAHGTLSLQPDGAFSYTPDAKFAGTDSFTYRASDGPNQSQPATVAIDVTPLAVTAAPTARGDSYTVANGTALTVAAPGVLANDAAADGTPLTVSVAANPGHGSLSLNPNGGFTYSPRGDYAGPDSFTYQASANGVSSAPTTVTILVTPTACGPRPRVQTTPVASGGRLQVHVEVTQNTPQVNPLASIRFGALQNAKVTLNGQAIASGQTFTLPASAHAVDFTVERVTAGQATTVPFVVVDGCGEWPSFVGGGPSGF